MLQNVRHFLFKKNQLNVWSLLNMPAETWDKFGTSSKFIMEFEEFIRVEFPGLELNTLTYITPKRVV